MAITVVNVIFEVGTLLGSFIGKRLAAWSERNR